MTNMRTHALVLVAALVGLSVVPVSSQEPASTANPQGFGVGPTSLSLKAKPGEQIRTSFNIQTQSFAANARFLVRAMDLGQPTAQGPAPVTLGQGARSCAAWMTLKDQYDLAATAVQEVPVVISVPKDCKGCYYAMVTVEYQPPSAGGVMSAVVKPSLTVQVEVEIVGQPATLSFDVAGLRLQKPKEPDAPPALVLSIKNTGDLKTTLAGDVLLRGPAGTFPLRAELPTKAGGAPLTIFPGAAVDVSMPVRQAVPPGDYVAETRCVLTGRRRVQFNYRLTVPPEPWSKVDGAKTDEAAYGLQFSVEPGLIDLDLPAGGQRMVPLRITNREDRDLSLRVRVALVRIEPDGLFTYAAGAADQAWITLPRQELTIRARQGQGLMVRLVSPRDRKDAETRVAVLVVEARPADSAPDAKSGVLGEVPVLVIARDPKGEPARLAGTLDLVRSSGVGDPRSAVVRVKNTGGRIGCITGNLVLLQTDVPREVSRLKVGDGVDEFILPGGEREFRLVLPPLNKGKFTVRATLSAEDKGKPLALQQSYEVSTGAPAGLDGPPVVGGAAPKP